MSVDAAIDLFMAAMLVAAKIAGPLLLTALLVGLVVGVLQAATQVNEASISFVTKLLAVGAVIVATGSWTLTQLVDYTARNFASISQVTK